MYCVQYFFQLIFVKFIKKQPSGLLEFVADDENFTVPTKLEILYYINVIYIFYISASITFCKDTGNQEILRKPNSIKLLVDD